jgi:hypothetical protein
MFFQSPNFYEVTRAPMLVARNPASFQLGIPPNQWEVEVQNWVNFLLAVPQTTITHIAARPGIVRPDFDQLAEPLDWPGLCSSQRMGAPDGFSNINVFALALVVALSGIIILTNLSLVPTLEYLHRRHGYFEQLMVSWNHENILQVQRKAYEGAGYPQWLGRDAAVPKTNNNMPIPGLGTEELAARISRKAPVNCDASRPEGSLPSPVTSHPHQPCLSSNHHLPLARSAKNVETLNRSEEVEGRNLSERNQSLAGMGPSIISGSASTSVAQIRSLDNQSLTQNIEGDTFDTIDQLPRSSNIRQGEPLTVATTRSPEAPKPSLQLNNTDGGKVEGLSNSTPIPTA